MQQCFVRQEIRTTAIRQQFRPEFINRIDEIVCFQSLQPQHMEHIVRKRLAQLQRALSERNIELVVDDAAIQWLAEQGYDPKMGAPPLMRLIGNQLTDRIGGILLSGELRDNDTILVRIKA